MCSMAKKVYVLLLYRSRYCVWHYQQLSTGRLSFIHLLKWKHIKPHCVFLKIYFFLIFTTKNLNLTFYRWAEFLWKCSFLSPIRPIIQSKFFIISFRLLIIYYSWKNIQIWVVNLHSRVILFREVCINLRSLDDFSHAEMMFSWLQHATWRSWSLLEKPWNLKTSVDNLLNKTILIMKNLS